MSESKYPQPEDYFGSSCIRCKHFLHSDREHGECRRFPRVWIKVQTANGGGLVDHEELEWNYPVMGITDSCGEFVLMREFVLIPETPSSEGHIHCEKCGQLFIESLVKGKESRPDWCEDCVSGADKLLSAIFGEDRIIEGFA